MKRLIFLAISAVALMGGAARADEAFDAFRNFCVVNHGAAASALAAADAAGWSPVPPQLLAQQAGLQNADGRMKAKAAGAGSILLTAGGSVPQLGPVRMCLVGVVPAGSSDLEGQLAAFAGVPKQVNADMPQGFYVWRDDNGRHIPLEQGTAEYRAQFASGTALIATIQSQPQMSMIVLISAAQ
jgi:hypothetical protein